MMTVVAVKKMRESNRRRGKIAIAAARTRTMPVKPPIQDVEPGEQESPDPNDSELLRDELKGETTEHARPPRLEDEGQSGG